MLSLVTGHAIFQPWNYASSPGKRPPSIHSIFKYYINIVCSCDGICAGMAGPDKGCGNRYCRKYLID